MDPNSFDAFKSLLSSETLRDIESLNPEEFGFGREECAGAGIPAKLRGSMALKEHIFYVSSMPHTQWSPKLENVPKFSSFSQLVKSSYSMTDNNNNNNNNKDDHHHHHHHPHHDGGRERKGNSTIPACNLAYSPDCSSQEHEYILHVHEAKRACPDAVKETINQHSSNAGQFAITRYSHWKEEAGGEEDGAQQGRKTSSLPWIVRAVPTLNGEEPSAHAREEDAGEVGAVRGQNDVDDRKTNMVAEGEEDFSDEYFIFVCAHLTRDKRCGFCGMVLMDLLSRCIREETEKRQGGTGTAEDDVGNNNHDHHTSSTSSRAAASTPPHITVFPCSHVGGHIYAGNILVYSRFGGVAFGLFRPQDVLTLVTALLDDKGEVPLSLVERVRGHIGEAYTHLE